MTGITPGQVGAVASVYGNATNLSTYGSLVTYGGVINQHWGIFSDGSFGFANQGFIGDANGHLLAASVTSTNFTGNGAGLTNITAAQVGADPAGAAMAATNPLGSAAFTASSAYQPTNVNLTTLSANNGGSLTNIPATALTNGTLTCTIGSITSTWNMTGPNQYVWGYNIPVGTTNQNGVYVTNWQCAIPANLIGTNGYVEVRGFEYGNSATSCYTYFYFTTTNGSQYLMNSWTDSTAGATVSHLYEFTIVNLNSTASQICNQYTVSSYVTHGDVPCLENADTTKPLVLQMEMKANGAAKLTPPCGPESSSHAINHEKHTFHCSSRREEAH